MALDSSGIAITALESGPLPARTENMIADVTTRRRKVLYGTGFFALLGALLGSYFGPKVIAWYFDPPVDIGVNCRSAVEWAMARLQVTQFCGLVIGLAVGFAVMMHRTRTGAPKPPAAGQPAPGGGGGA